MAMDGKGNNHKAAGRPDGGQFDKKAGQGTDDDLEEAAAPEIPAWDRIKDTDDSREALLELARAMSSWDGSCDWADATEPEELMSELGFDPAAAMTLVDAVGDDYYPTLEFVRFNDAGMLESVDESDLEREAWDNREEILDAVQSARDDMDFTSWTDDDVADSLAKLDVNGED